MREAAAPASLPKTTLMMGLDETAGAVLGEKELRRHLGERLPEHMIPKVFIFLEEIPLTRNGKVDREALLSLRGRPDAAGANYRKPRTQAERDIAAAWRRVLGVEREGLDQNFFDLGGHSLLMVELSRVLRKELGRDIPVVTLFQYPTVELLAGYLSKQHAEGDLLERASGRAEKRMRAAIRLFLAGALGPPGRGQTAPKGNKGTARRHSSR